MIIVDGLVWVSEWLVCSRCGEVFTMNARVAAMESIQLMERMYEPLCAGGCMGVTFRPNLCC